MDIMKLKADDLVVVVLGQPNYQTEIGLCLRELGDRRVPYSVHLLDSDSERAREEVSALAYTQVKVVIVVDIATNKRPHLAKLVADELSQQAITVFGVVLPTSQLKVEQMPYLEDVSLVWTPAIRQAAMVGAVSATIVMTQEKVAQATLAG